MNQILYNGVLLVIFFSGFAILIKVYFDRKPCGYLSFLIN